MEFKLQEFKTPLVITRIANVQIMTLSITVRALLFKPHKFLAPV